MAHRRGVQDRVAGRNRIDLAEISVARRCEHAMGEHRALGTAGGARGVEQPGEIVAGPRHDRDRLGIEQGGIFRAADRDQPLETCGCVRRDLGLKARRGEADPRARMLEDEAELAAMQLGVRRHRGKPGVPDAVHQGEIIDRVLGRDGDAIAGLKRAALA